VYFCSNVGRKVQQAKYETDPWLKSGRPAVEKSVEVLLEKLAPLILNSFNYPSAIFAKYWRFYLKMLDWLFAAKEISTNDAGIYIIWISSLWVNNNCRNLRHIWQSSNNLLRIKSTRTFISSWLRLRMLLEKAIIKWLSFIINMPTTSSRNSKPILTFSTKELSPTILVRPKNKLSRMLLRNINQAPSTKMAKLKQQWRATRKKILKLTSPIISPKSYKEMRDNHLPKPIQATSQKRRTMMLMTRIFASLTWTWLRNSMNKS